MDFEVDAKRVEPYDPADAFRFYTEMLPFQERLSDTWGGVTWSRLMGDGFSIGATVYAALRSQRGRQQVIGAGVTADSLGSSLGLVSDYNYWNVRGLAKVGFTYEGERFSTGAAITLPSVSLFGSGQTFLSASGINIPTDPSGDRSSFVNE